LGGIYITGPSGTGKTTFCKVMSANYGFSHCIETIKTMIQKNPDIKNLDFYERQIVFIVEFIKQHHIIGKNFLADRSLLDVLAWTDVNPEIVKHLGLFRQTPDLLVIIPTPPWSWYKHYEDKFLISTRFGNYRDKLNIPPEREIVGDNALNIMYDVERSHSKAIMDMVRHLGWNHYVAQHSLRPEEFIPSWQKDVERKVFEVWDVKRFSVDAFNITDEEREQVRQYLIEKREKNLEQLVEEE
jgi:hypothetical protein